MSWRMKSERNWGRLGMKFETYSIAELIDEIAMGPFGSNIKVECFVDDGIPVLNGSNLNGFFLTENSFRYVTEKKADSLGRANAHRGDIVITHRGTLGQIVCIPETSKYDRYVISQSQFRVRCNEKVLPEYLVYYFHTTIGQHKLLSNASQVGVPALARASTTFQKIEVEIPDIDTQRKVVSILNLLEKKISINNLINKNLEQQAQAIFDDMFPDIFSLNTDATLQDLIVFANGKKRPKTIGNIPVYGGNGILAYTDKSNADNCVIIGRVGAYCGNTFLCLDKCWTSDNAIQAKDRTGSSPLFIYYLLRNASLSSRHIGTGQPLMTQGILNAIPIKYPVEEKISAFIETCSPIHKMISGNRQQNESLASIRDSMLPKLMSGEMDVSELNL